jgi:hypothetical protein
MNSVGLVPSSTQRNLLDKSLKELEGLVYCDVWFNQNSYFIDSEWETVIPFNQIGMPLTCLSVERTWSP